MVREADKDEDCVLAMKRVMEGALVQSSPLVEPSVNLGVDLEVNSSIELRETQTEDSSVVCCSSM